jgi:hypothetical protein
MQKHRNEDEQKAERDLNPEIPLEPDEELVIDPDDEPEYLQDVLSDAVNDFEKLKDEELNKQLADLNVDMDDEEQLLKKLTPEELKAFHRLAEEMFEIPQKSCFR